MSYHYYEKYESDDQVISQNDLTYPPNGYLLQDSNIGRIIESFFSGVVRREI